MDKDQALREAMDTLAAISDYLTTDEGDKEYTEDRFGIDYDEVIQMAHDNMITIARYQYSKIKELLNE